MEESVIHLGRRRGKVFPFLPLLLVVVEREKLLSPFHNPFYKLSLSHAERKWKETQSGLVSNASDEDAWSIS